MDRKQEPQKTFWSGSITAHYPAPKLSFRDEGRVLNFVLASLDYRRERKGHVIGTKFLPQFWKVYKVNMNKKLLQMPLAPISGKCWCFTLSVVALLPMHLGTLVIGKFTGNIRYLTKRFDSKLSDLGNHNSADIYADRALTLVP